MTFTYSNSFRFSLEICYISLQKFFKKPNVTDDFINLRCLSISFTIFILNIMVDLCTLISLTSLMNFSFSLNLVIYWYAMQTMFFFFLRNISSYSFIMMAESSDFSSLSVFSFNSCVSILSIFIIESISCCFISTFQSLHIFLVFSEPFFYL